MMKTLKLQDPREAGRLVARGALVAFPTETVFGLGAHAGNPEAVRRVFVAKGRPQDNPLIVHVAGLDQVGLAARDLGPAELVLLRTFAPGPLTVILPRRFDLAPEVSPGLDTVGVRIPRHPVARLFLEAAGVPVAAPSANRSGRPSPTNFAMAWEEMEGRVDAVLDGDDSTVGLESTIVWLDRGTLHVLRPGTIPAAAMLHALEDAGLPHRLASPGAARGDAPRSPGTRYRHYSPRARVHLWSPGTDPRALAQRIAGLEGAGGVSVLVPRAWGGALDAAIDEAGLPVLHRPPVEGPEAFARLLYRGLGEADAAGAQDVILGLEPARDPQDPLAGVVEALRDRCRRAAGME